MDAQAQGQAKTKGESAGVRRTYPRRLRSLDNRLWDAREYLRSRLSLLEPTETSFAPEPGSADAARAWAADELILKLIQHAELGPDPRGLPNGERELKKFLAKHPEPSVSWDRLVEERWVRVIWGRWHAPYQLQTTPRTDQPVAGQNLILALAHLRIAARQPRAFVVPNAERLIEGHRLAHSSTPPLETLISDGLLTVQGDEIHLAARSSVLVGCGEWLAARLWDRIEAGPPDSKRLGWWRDRIFGLGVRWYTFGEQLGTAARDSFLELAWKQILEDPDLIGWDQERVAFAAYIAASAGIGSLQSGLDVVEEFDSDEPVARMRWLSLSGHNNNQEERDELDALISVVFRWRTAFRSPTPFESWIERFVEAVATRPHLLTAMNSAVGRSPVIAADLLLVPTAAAFGVCALATRMKRSPAGCDQDVRADDDRNIEQMVWRLVAECAASSIHKLPSAQTASQITSLLVHFAGLASPNAYDVLGRHATLVERNRALREALVRWPAERAGNVLPFDLIGAEVVNRLSADLDEAKVPLECIEFDVLAWLTAFGCDGHAPWRESAARAVVRAYCHSLQVSSNRFKDLPIDANTWIRIARLTLSLEGDIWPQLIEGDEFGPAMPHSASPYVEQRSLVHRVRAHLLVLSIIVGNWERIQPRQPVPESVQLRIVALLQRWLTSDESTPRPSVIEADVDIEFSPLPRAQSLLVSLAQALPMLDSPRRTVVRDLLLAAMTEVRQLATFVQALADGPDKDAARQKLREQEVLEGSDDINNFVQVQRSVDALLDAEEPGRAASWLKIWADKARKRRVEGWERWEVAAIQRIRLARGEFEVAANAEVPEWAKNDFEAERTNNFFRGVALLRTDPPRCEEAAAIYQQLVLDAPQRPAYAVNLFAARTQLATQGRDDVEPAPDEDDDLRALLADGESLLSAFSAEQRAAVEQTYQVNRLYIFHRLHDWSSLLEAYQSLPKPLQSDPTLASYAARAFERRDQPALGQALLADLGLAHQEPAAPPAGTERLDSTRAAYQTILELPRLTPVEQGKIWWGKPLPEGLTDAVVEVCMALAGIAPALAVPTKGSSGTRIHEEDRVTKLIAELLRQQLARLGWSVHSQEHGGYTAKDPSEGRAGIGEIDLEVRSGSDRIIVGEAVLVQSFKSAYIKKHYQKLFGYAPSGTLLVAMIWSYSQNPGDVWQRYLREIVEKEAPPQFEFLGWLLPETGPFSDVWHAVSEHSHPVTGKCRVVHTLADLQQHAQRSVGASARRAAGTAARRASKRRSAGAK